MLLAGISRPVNADVDNIAPTVSALNVHFVALMNISLAGALAGLTAIWR